jgi:hypothetical protein
VEWHRLIAQVLNLTVVASRHAGQLMCRLLKGIKGLETADVDVLEGVDVLEKSHQKAKQSSGGFPSIVSLLLCVLALLREIVYRSFSSR